MRFLIQEINKKVRHDFSLTLLESIRFQTWLTQTDDIKVKYLDYFETIDPDIIYPIQWKPMHRNYVPVGSVEFVSEFLGHFHNHIPKPINVPEELFGYVERTMWNGNENGYRKGYGKLFVKSNDIIKGFKLEIKEDYELPKGNYQFSELIDIESEWRCFVYQNKLVGLENYSGDFSMFPNIEQIKYMIQEYKSAPVAYTLDVGVHDDRTFVIEAHSMMSVGLYGFSDHKILPYMFHRAFKEIINEL